MAILEDEDRATQSSPMHEVACETCLLCGTAGKLQYRRLPDRLFGVPGEWSIRKCENTDCGMLWLDPKPIGADLHMAYTNYYTHDDGDSSNIGSRGGVLARRIIELIEGLWLWILGLRSNRRAIEHMFLEGVGPGRVLEVGCGDGRMLNRLRQLGWVVEGQDVDPRAAGLQSNDVVVHLGELSDLNLIDESYDAVVMNHVIEHAENPIELLRLCRRLLKPGGILVATTPNPDSFGHRVFGAAWRGLDAPRHLNLFPLKALARVSQAAAFAQWDLWTSPARAGGMLAGSRDIEKRGFHRMRGSARFSHLFSAFRYQLLARFAHARSPDSGEEAVLWARK